MPVGDPICGHDEDFAKTPLKQQNREDKITDYGALHVEQFIGRLLRTLAPPADPVEDARWTVPSTHNPRMLYSDVLLARTANITNVSSMVKLTYNLGDNDGNLTTEVLIPNLTPSPCYGVKKIEVVYGGLSVYGGFAAPLPQ